MKTPASKISRIIIELIKKYVPFGEPRDINDGRCGDFARDVVAQVPGAKVVWDCEITTEFERVPNSCHCVVEYRGRYYDSENPEGVDKLQDLQFYLRLADTI